MNSHQLLDNYTSKAGKFSSKHHGQPRLQYQQLTLFMTAPPPLPKPAQDCREENREGYRRKCELVMDLLSSVARNEGGIQVLLALVRSANW